jgi:nitrogen-specific signal transduction histidine kinase
VSTRAGQDAVVIEVGDTGPGMAPQVAVPAFEALYTTEDADKGTGLGLDIAQRIVVERHGDTITIDSPPGETVLWVRIPLRPPAVGGERPANPLHRSGPTCCFAPDRTRRSRHQDQRRSPDGA